MKYDLVIFDLDGTLLNTLDDLAAAANYALLAQGFPGRSTEEVRCFIGGGVARLIRRAVPEGTDEAVCLETLDTFKRYYMEHINVHTRPYDGIPAMLEALKVAGIRTAVNSNKVDAATQLLCRDHFGGLLDAAMGEREDIPRKPAPDGALRLMAELDAQPSRTLYVGDGDADIMTAKNAGFEGAWVSWGYRRREELAGLEIPRAFDTVEDLKNYISV